MPGQPRTRCRRGSNPVIACCSDLRVGGTTGATRMVSLQVAASAIGSAALPAGLGLAIGAVNARILAPSLVLLGLAMGGLYVFGSRWSGRAGPPVTPRA